MVQLRGFLPILAHIVISPKPRNNRLILIRKRVLLFKALQESNRRLRRDIGKGLLQDPQMINLINITIKFLNKVRIEIERQLALHIVRIDEVQDGFG